MKKFGNHIKTPRSNSARFFILLAVCVGMLVILSVAFIVLGAKAIRLSDIWNALFRFDAEEINQVIVRNLRIPRLLADIIVGVSLSVSGAVMQGNTKNPMADSGIMGISAGSMFAVMLIMAFLPSATKLEIIG